MNAQSIDKNFPLFVAAFVREGTCKYFVKQLKLIVACYSVLTLIITNAGLYIKQYLIIKPFCRLIQNRINISQLLKKSM